MPVYNLFFQKVSLFFSVYPGETFRSQVYDYNYIIFFKVFQKRCFSCLLVNCSQNVLFPKKDLFFAILKIMNKLISLIQWVAQVHQLLCKYLIKLTDFIVFVMTILTEKGAARMTERILYTVIFNLR